MHLQNEARQVPRVMICEDEPIVALDLTFIMEDLGYEVCGCFASVREGLDAVPECRPDVAVLDVRLRDGEVFPVAEKLCEANVPVIFHSGHVALEDIATRFPGAGFCPKPTTAKRLGDCLRDVMLQASGSTFSAMPEVQDSVRD